MKRYSNILKFISVVLMMLFVMAINPAKTIADTEEKDFIVHENEGDLAVMFSYDGEQPDIAFISPSGKEYVVGVNPVEEIEAVHGEGFSSYRIYNAEVGQWKIRLDRKDNGDIEYTIIEDMDGIVIQSFEIVKMNETSAKVLLDVTKGEDEVVTYEYTIYAIAGENTDAKKELYSGYAETGAPTELELDLNLSSYGDYRLLLEVVYTDGLEMFDSMMTNSFSYRNPNTPEAIEDFWVYVYGEKNLFELNWDEFGKSGWDLEYNVVAIADGDSEKPIYTGTVYEEGTSFYYPKEAKEVEITLYYKVDGVLSDSVSKKINLENGEYLLMDTDNVTGDSQVKFTYSADGDATLQAIINEEQGSYNIKGENDIMFGLVTGVNDVDVRFEGKNRIVYCVKEEVYYSIVSPEINFYEDINGKTFKSGEAVIYGKVTNTEKLYINDKEVTVDENGEFNHTVELSEGDNNVVVKATSNTGVSTVKNIFVKNQSSVLSAVTSYIPTIVIAVIVVLLMVLSFVFVGKKKEEKKKGSVLKVSMLLSGILCVLSIVLYIWIRMFNRGSGYLALVKESVGKASSYLTYETLALIFMIAISTIFVGLIVAFCVIKLIKKPSKV